MRLGEIDQAPLFNLDVTVSITVYEPPGIIERYPIEPVAIQYVTYQARNSGDTYY